MKRTGAEAVYNTHVVVEFETKIGNLVFGLVSKKTAPRPNVGRTLRARKESATKSVGDLKFDMRNIQNSISMWFIEVFTFDEMLKKYRKCLLGELSDSCRFHSPWQGEKEREGPRLVGRMMGDNRSVLRHLNNRGLLRLD